MAYFPGLLVSGVCLHSARRQPARPAQTAAQPACGVVFNRIVAWSELEFYRLGSLFRLPGYVRKAVFAKGLYRLPRFAGHAYTLAAVIIGWAFFEYENLGAAAHFLGTMFGFGAHGLADRQALYDLSAYSGWLILLMLCATPFPRRLLLRFRRRWGHWGSAAALGTHLLLLFLSTAYLVSETYNPFLYFRF